MTSIRHHLALKVQLRHSLAKGFGPMLDLPFIGHLVFSVRHAIRQFDDTGQMPLSTFLRCLPNKVRVGFGVPCHSAQKEIQQEPLLGIGVAVEQVGGEGGI
jgi:hypothetical protein